LQQTVALIQQLPERPAPRNFTLDARTFGKPPLPFLLTMTFSALSTAAAVLLLVFGGYFLLQADTRQQTASIDPQQQPVAQNIAPTQAAAIAALPSATAAPTQTMPSLAAAVEATPGAGTEIQSQMAQTADRERDETAATESEPAANNTDLFFTGEDVQAPPESVPAAEAAGTIGQSSTSENEQALPAGEALEESRNQVEAPMAFGDNAASGIVGGGTMATAAAPAIARPSPTTIAALKSSDVPDSGFRETLPLKFRRMVSGRIWQTRMRLTKVLMGDWMIT
jgi:hypothetical protein